MAKSSRCPSERFGGEWGGHLAAALAPVIRQVAHSFLLHDKIRRYAERFQPLIGPGGARHGRARAKGARTARGRPKSTGACGRSCGDATNATHQRRMLTGEDIAELAVALLFAPPPPPASPRGRAEGGFGRSGSQTASAKTAKNAPLRRLSWRNERSEELNSSSRRSTGDRPTCEHPSLPSDAHLVIAGAPKTRKKCAKREKSEKRTKIARCAAPCGARKGFRCVLRVGHPPQSIGGCLERRHWLPPRPWSPWEHEKSTPARARRKTAQNRPPRGLPRRTEGSRRRKRSATGSTGDRPMCGHPSLPSAAPLVVVRAPRMGCPNAKTRKSAKIDQWRARRGAPRHASGANHASTPRQPIGGCVDTRRSAAGRPSTSHEVEKYDVKIGARPAAGARERPAPSGEVRAARGTIPAVKGLHGIGAATRRPVWALVARVPSQEGARAATDPAGARPAWRRATGNEKELEYHGRLHGLLQTV